MLKTAWYFFYVGPDVFFVFAKALRVLKSLQIHGVILGGWAKLHELAEQLLDGIFARNCSFFVDKVVVTVDPHAERC